MKLQRVRGTAATVVSYPGWEVLFSYSTPVAAKGLHECFRTEKHYSVTTSKHINQWLDGREATVVSQSFLDDLVSA